MALTKQLLVLCGLCLLLNVSWADYYYLYRSSGVLAHTTLTGHEYIADSHGLHKKIGDYYELVFQFKHNTKRALFVDSQLFIDGYQVTITPHKITDTAHKQTIPATIKLKPYWLKTKLSHVYIKEAISSKDKDNLVFKFRNTFYLGLLAKDNVVKEVIKNGQQGLKIKFSDLDQSGDNKLVVEYKNKTRVYRKQGLSWVKTYVTAPLSKAQLRSLSADELAMKRFRILARHGKLFDDKTIQKYFNKQAWYQPNSRFSLKSLSTQEKKNIKLLYDLEISKRRTALEDKPHATLPQ